MSAGMGGAGGTSGTGAAKGASTAGGAAAGDASPVAGGAGGSCAIAATDPPSRIAVPTTIDAKTRPIRQEDLGMWTESATAPPLRGNDDIPASMELMFFISAPVSSRP